MPDTPAQAYAAFLAAHPAGQWEATDEAVFCGAAIIHRAGTIAPHHRPAAARLALRGPLLASLAQTMLHHFTASEARRRASRDPAEMAAAEMEREMAEMAREVLIAAGVLDP